MAVRVELPGNGWTPRDDQMPIWQYLNRTEKSARADICAHRRYGKDDICLHWGAVASQRRVGTYWHMLPEAAQARKAIWDAVNPRTGKRRIDEAFPMALRATTRDTDMLIRFKNGSTWQVLGSDNYNSFVGSPPIGVTFSEWSLANPSSWSYVRPILLENGGWALFLWTPRGRNHATRAFESRQKDSEWFTMRMPATKTSVFTPEQLEKERREMIEEAGSVQEGEALFRTEYLVDFDAPVPGAYYAENIMAAADEYRIGDIGYNPKFPVYTSWDLGMDDYTAIWFFQKVAAGYYNFIDYYETQGLGFEDISKDRPGIVTEAFKGKMGWKFGMHYLPHDVAVRELGAKGMARKLILMKLGVKPIRQGVPRDLDESIPVVRKFLKKCRFNVETCEVGIEHLKQYRKKFNKSLGVYTGEQHDEHSHAADALREAAMNAGALEFKAETIDRNPNDRWAKLRKQRKGPSSWKTA